MVSLAFGAAPGTYHGLYLDLDASVSEEPRSEPKEGLRKRFTVNTRLEDLETPPPYSTVLCGSISTICKGNVDGPMSVFSRGYEPVTILLLSPWSILSQRAEAHSESFWPEMPDVCSRLRFFERSFV